MKKEIEKLNTDEEKCLQALAILTGYDQYTYFRIIASQTGFDIKTTRKNVRSLREKGFAEYSRGLMTEDGEVAGAGYIITEKGKEYVDKNKL